MTISEYVDVHIKTIAMICGKRDDLHQIAIIGCMKAFEQSKDDPTECINNEIEKFLQAQIRQS